MSIKVHRHHTVTCDFCGMEHGTVGEYDSAGAARRGALSCGWKLVPKLLSSGRRGKSVDPADDRALGLATATQHDACPSCPACNTCNGTPPPGFTCNSCGTKGPAQ